MVGIDPTRLPTPEDVDEATADTEDASARSNFFDDPRHQHQQQRRLQHRHYVIEQPQENTLSAHEDTTHDHDEHQGMDDPHGRAAMALTSLSMGDELFVERRSYDQEQFAREAVRRRGERGVDFGQDASARTPWPRATVAEAQLLFEATQTSATDATTPTATGYDVTPVTPRPLDEITGGDIGATRAKRIVSPSTKTQEKGGASRAVAGSMQETIHATPHSLVRSLSSSSISSDIPARGLVRPAPLPQEDALATDEYHPRGRVQNVSCAFFSLFRLTLSNISVKLIEHCGHISHIVIPFAESKTIPSEPQVRARMGGGSIRGRIRSRSAS